MSKQTKEKYNAVGDDDESDNFTAKNKDAAKSEAHHDKSKKDKKEVKMSNTII